jgi:hypothetical protein
MPSLSSGYNPPGVYVSSDSSSVTGVVGVQPTVACLVGPGLGYQTATDTLVFPSLSTPLKLSQLGVQQSSIAVSYIDGGGVSHNLTLGTDYTVSATDGSYPDTVTTITPVGTGALPVNTSIFVAYRYANANYFAVNSFTDFASLIAVYGNPFNSTTGAIQSPLSLAAQIAFENGANQVYTVALSGLGSLSDQYRDAYTLTESLNVIDITVPVFAENAITDNTDLPSFISRLVTHLQNCEADGFPRVGIMGVGSGFSDSVTPDIIAQEFNYKRVVFVWPKELLYYNNFTNSTVTIGGTYLAAACAGVLCNNPVNQGLTRRQIRSFSGITLKAAQSSTTTNKNTWSAAGVAVAEVNRLGQLVIRHGTTTDPSVVTKRELSIVRCQDALFNLVQQSLDQAQLIGSPITTDTPLTVKSIITGALETAVSTNSIQAYNNVSVRQQALPNGDPTVIECLFSYQPTYPLNYITVVLTLDLTTGQVTTTDSAAA